MVGLTENKLSEKIIGAAIEVHRELGPGLLESMYESALFFDLHSMELNVRKQVPVETQYKGQDLEIGFRVDLLVENKVIIELKTVDKITDVHLAQILTYLKLRKNKLGLILNFNVKYMKNGVKRVVNNL